VDCSVLLRLLGLLLLGSLLELERALLLWLLTARLPETALGLLMGLLDLPL